MRCVRSIKCEPAISLRAWGTLLDGSVPRTHEGYNHSLGHGLGLDSRTTLVRGIGGYKHRLVPGTVFTIEPGLYYPERGMGIRLEDSYYVTPQGKIELFTEFPMDLVLPVRKG